MERVSLDDLSLQIKSLQEKILDMKESMYLKEKLVYNNKDLQQMFNVSLQTLSKWRENGELGFSRKGNIFVYTKEDIMNFVEKFHYDAYSL